MDHNGNGYIQIPDNYYKLHGLIIEFASVPNGLIIEFCPVRTWTVHGPVHVQVHALDLCMGLSSHFGLARPFFGSYSRAGTGQFVSPTETTFES